VTGPGRHRLTHAEPGSLFVALPGEHTDGHDFAAAAVADGAVAVLAAREVDAPCVVVDDPAFALGRLARSVIDRLGTTVVAVTGSSGKTTTKDMLASVLGPTGAGRRPAGVVQQRDRAPGHRTAVRRVHPRAGQ
jgi:UDP-N-acetylmuramoyl-tripeptide--D-alanyl-D-alanine ligase